MKCVSPIQYDFETTPNRNHTGAVKWLHMHNLNPQASPDVIPFSVADMELSNPPEITAGLQSFLANTVLGYTTATPSYHEAACNWMRRKHHWTIQPEWILQWPGVVPALYDLVRILTQPGDGILIMTPVYHPFYQVANLSGRVSVENPLILKEQRYEIDYEDLEHKAKQPNTKLLILCNPHNPVGRCWSREELEQVGRICLAHGVLVISDEIHFDLMMPGFRHTVFASLSKDLEQNTIVCTAPSKTFNLAGLQVSNIIIPNEKLCAQVQEARKQNGSHSLNALAYRACEIAYTQCDEWLNQLLALLAHNRDFLTHYLKENIPQIKPIPLEATYLQWLDCRELAMSPKELEAFMRTRAQLFLNEGYMFGNAGAGFERMNLACPTHHLEKALLRLKKALAAL